MNDLEGSGGTSDIRGRGESDRHAADREEKEKALKSFEKFLSESSGLAGGLGRDVPAARRRVFPRAVLGGLLAFLFFGGLSLAVAYVSFRERISERIVSDISRLQSSLTIEGLKDPGKARRDLEAFGSGSNPFGEIGGRFLSLFKGSLGAYRNFQGLAADFSLLLGEASTLVNDGPSLFFSGRGGELVGHLKTAQTLLGRVDEKSAALAASSEEFRSLAPIDLGFYLPLKIDVARFRSFADALLAWLSGPEPRRAAVFLGNSSELRPAGGFFGSYADLTVASGSVAAFAVHDINDADRLLDSRVIPPKPLQAVTASWKAADANWFFDFSDSAAKTIEFLESSKLYRSSSTLFDGAVGISPAVVSGVLSITGPIDLSDPKISIDSGNFLFEIQKQIQTGRQSGASYPKKILQELAPILIKRIGSFKESERSALASLAAGWLKKKDVMFYFKDPEIQKFLASYQTTGSPYRFPQGWNGDYLAVPSANMASGKSDIFIEQTVSVQSQLSESGIVKNHLEITRKHTGNTAKYSWYKLPNESYFKVFTPPGARLENASGARPKKIVPKANYEKGGYRKDPLVSVIEATEKESLSYPAVTAFEESGKNVFGFWTKVDPGKTATASLDYSFRTFAPPSDGGTYAFVFEKQPAASSKYLFEISAPVGFRWKENGLPVFEYASDDPPGRLTLTLTLKRM